MPGIVIIGSGMAGSGLALELASKGEPVTLITAETAGYYSRPLLSHAFSDPTIQSRILLKQWSELEAAGITLMTGTAVDAINRDSHEVIWKNAHESGAIAYSRLVLATGSDALIPAAWKDQRSHFRVLNSFTDMVSLTREIAPITEPIAIIGGGLIGCEVASDLTKAGKQVVLFHSLDRLMERQLTVTQSGELLDHFKQTGVDVRLHTPVLGFEKESVLTSVGSVRAGLILVAVGFAPRTELARQAGLPVNRGIITNSFLQTSDASIYALGDVAEVNGTTWAYVLPIRSQVKWLADHLTVGQPEPWTPVNFPAKAKIHGLRLVW